MKELTNQIFNDCLAGVDPDVREEVRARMTTVGAECKRAIVEAVVWMLRWYDKTKRP